MFGGMRSFQVWLLTTAFLGLTAARGLAAAPSGAGAAAAGAFTAPSGLRLRPMQEADGPQLRPLEDAAPAAPAGGPVIGAVVPTGGEELPRPVLMAAIAPFVGRPADPETLKALTVAVTRLARSQGFIFARCFVPAQTPEAGVLKISIDLGRIDEVRFNGPGNGSVKGLFDKLVGKPVRKGDLDRALMLAGDVPGVTLGRPDYQRLDGRGVLTVPIGYTRFTGGVLVDNRGLKGEGPARLQAAAAARGFMTDRDEVSAQIITTPGNTRELVSVSGRYSIDLNPNGASISATYGYLHANPNYVPSAPLPNVDIQSAEISLSQVLLRRAAESAWLDVAFNYASSRQSLGWWQEIDRIPTVYGDINGYAPLLGGRLRAGVSAAYELRALGVTPVVLSNAYGAVYDNTGFLMVDGWANWTGQLVGPLSATVAVTAQTADRPLPFLQKISLGGASFGRAYELGERTGDRGVMGSAEVRAMLLKHEDGWMRRLEFYLYTDGGKVTNFYGAVGGGELYSYGAGFRAELARNLKLGLEIAEPLTQLPDAKSPRLNATAEADF